jgi:catechol 2,3-dioxygenase-like lactoylglutathione lyase family enzyme
MLKGIAFTVYAVSDMTRARQFYENVLGLIPSRNINNEFFLEYDLGENTFAIGCKTPELYKRPSSSIAFEVDNLDIALEKIKQHNIPILYGPSDNPGCRTFAIADPDGNLITLHELK